MLVNINDIGGEVIKDNTTYKLKDNTLLNNLVVSSTDLKPYQSTNGHKHPGQEEQEEIITKKIENGKVD